VEAALRDVGSASRLSGVNLSEVVDVMTRIYQRPVDDTMTALAMLESGGLVIVPADAAIGALAGELHARHYDRKASPLSMAGCVALATAIVIHDALATSDQPLTSAARTENVTVLPLPDSRGIRPAS
jgi:hypothetical protein